MYLFFISKTNEETNKEYSLNSVNIFLLYLQDKQVISLILEHIDVLIVYSMIYTSNYC